MYTKLDCIDKDPRFHNALHVMFYELALLSWGWDIPRMFHPFEIIIGDQNWQVCKGFYQPRNKKSKATLCDGWLCCGLGYTYDPSLKSAIVIHKIMQIIRIRLAVLLRTIQDPRASCYFSKSGKCKQVLLHSNQQLNCWNTLWVKV